MRCGFIGEGGHYKRRIGYYHVQHAQVVWFIIDEELINVNMISDFQSFYPVVVTIVDVNDNTPEFASQLYETNVNEVS